MGDGSLQAGVDMEQKLTSGLADIWEDMRMDVLNYLGNIALTPQDRIEQRNILKTLNV